MRPLSVLRIATGLIVLVHLQPFVADALRGETYRDSFYEPYAGWYPEATGGLYTGLLLLGAAAAAAMTVGLWTRVTTVVTLGIVAYNLFLSTTHVHNNRAYLIIVLAVLAMAPCGRELSVDAWSGAGAGRPPLDPTAPAWPLWLLRFEASVVYGASALSKLVDPDWFGGTVTWLRVMHVRDQLAASILPDWTVELLLERSFHTGAAKVIVLTELFIAIGLWLRPTRYVAIVVAIGFHIAIELTARVEVFSYLAVAVLVIWAVPVHPGPGASPRPRRASTAPGHRGGRARLAGAVPRRARSAGLRRRRSLTATAPCSAGAPAVAFTLSRLPLDRLVRAARAAAPGRPPRSPRRSRDDARSRGRERTMIRKRFWGAAPLALALALGFAFTAVAPPQHCPPVPPLPSSALRPRPALDWFVRNQDEDGTWVYLYNAEDDLIASEVQRGPPRRGDDGSLPGRRRGPARGAGVGGPGHRVGARHAVRAATAGPRLEYLGEVSTGASALLAAGLAIRTRGHRRATATTTSCAGSGASCSRRPSRPGAVLAQYDPTAGRAGAGRVLRLLHRARPTGRWRSSTWPSPARAGARPRTASAPTSRRRATRSRTTGRRSPTTGPPTARPRRVEFPERADPPLTEAEVGLRAPAGGAVRRARPAGSASSSGRGARLVRGGDTPRGGGYGVISEALTGWWLVAQAEPRLADLQEPIAERATCVAGPRHGCEQSDEEDAASAAQPRAGRGRLVPRRRDPHGRPAARARRAPADDPDRRGERRPVAGESE